MNAVNIYNVQPILLCLFSRLLQTLKLKRFRSFSGKCFRFFPVCFRCFSGLIPEKRPEKHQKKAETFSGKRAESFKF